MKKIAIAGISVVILAGSLAVFAVFQTNPNAGDPNGDDVSSPVAVLDSGETLLEFVQRDVTATRPNLPLRVDEFTTWETIEAVGTHIRYGYRLGVEVPEAELEALREALTQDLPRQICAAAEMAQFLSLGGTSSFIYVDATDREVATIQLSGADCN